MQCPNCGLRLQDSPELAGQEVSCPQCRATFVATSPGPQSSVPSEQIAFDTIASAARGNLIRVARRRLKPSTSVLDLFDWKFEKYLTPWIVRATWIVVLTLSAIWLGLLTVGLLVSFVPESKSASSRQVGSRPVPTFEQPNRPRVELRPPQLADDTKDYFLRNAFAVMGYVTGIFGLALFLLWVRVVLESLIVLFNIAESLTTIDQRIAKAVRHQ